MTNENPELENEQANEEIPTAEILESAADVDLNDVVDPVVVIDSLKAKLAEAEKRVLLGQADLENFRRRKAKESQDQIKYASLPLCNALLEVVDNLDRALESAETEADAASLKQGVEMVADQLQGTLSNHGCQKMETVGQPFDPNLHEAIQMQVSDEPANTILMEVQTGYKLHDRVVRPAKVIISKGPA